MNWKTGLFAAGAAAAIASLGAMTGGCTGSTTTVVYADSGINCGAGAIDCGGTCTVVARDAENCGTCGKKCAAGEVCSAGTCAASCQSGTTKCGNECVDTKSDSRNCGACGTKCTNIQVCNAGACAAGCTSGLTTCGSACVNAQTDRTNCGGCGTMCKDGEVCTAGKCDISCQAGLTKCSVAQSDGGVADASSEASVDASSDASSDGGLAATYCANLQVDNTNCGACGTTCTGNQKCVAGKCAATSTVRQTSGTEIAVSFVPCGNGTNTNCTKAVAISSCAAIGKKLVSHASNGSSGVVSLGATSSCQWSISYFVNYDSAAAGKCLIGISNADSSVCCGLTDWHGNIVPIPATLGQQFGFVNSGNTGYNANLNNVSGTTWGCQPATQAPPANGACASNAYFVACN